MKRILLTGLVILGISTQAKAVYNNPQDTIISASDTIITNFGSNLDSMMQLYIIHETFDTSEFAANYNEDSLVKEFNKIPDSVFIERLNAIPSAVDLSYNNIVRSYIRMYVTKKRESVEVMLGLANYYFPIFDDIFDYYDVPNEMKYMAIIESALNPNAYSRARAVGLWQFMYSTGRIYGLTINSMVDDRRDPIKSTHAAAQFVNSLNNIYNDWILVIAGYNCGPGNVNKAIRRSGGKKNYWDIYYYLPRETRGHVPAFIAATYVMHYYKEHDIIPRNVDLPYASDTLMINDKLHLKQVSEVLGIPLKLLQDLNPQYRADIVPANPKNPMALRIPLDKSSAFIDLQDSIFSYKDSIFFNPQMATKAPASYASSSHNTHSTPKNKAKLYYTVKSGDNVGFIASWYDVSQSDLSYWNNIRRNLIRSGQKLVVYVPEDKEDYYKPVNSMTFAEKQKREGIDVTPKPQIQPADDSNAEYVYYTVRSGDTLWEIARKFPGVSDTDIMRLNNISNAGKIQPGQRIKIKKKI